MNKVDKIDRIMEMVLTGGKIKNLLVLPGTGFCMAAGKLLKLVKRFSGNFYCAKNFGSAILQHFLCNFLSHFFAFGNG